MMVVGPEQLCRCDGGRDGDHFADGNNSWVIDPQESQFSRSWDLVVMVLMLYTATVTPFEVRGVVVGGSRCAETQPRPCDSECTRQQLPAHVYGLCSGHGGAEQAHRF
jgi:hypothetical protein